MTSLNLCQFIGNVAQEPRVEKVTTANGQVERALFSLAIQSHWKDSDNHNVTHTEFVDFIAWGPQAIIIRKFVRLGARIYISGRIQTDRWVDERSGVGVKRKRSQIRVSEIKFLDGSRKGKGLPDPVEEKKP